MVDVPVLCVSQNEKLPQIFACKLFIKNLFQILDFSHSITPMLLKHDGNEYVPRQKCEMQVSHLNTLFSVCLPIACVSGPTGSTLVTE